MTQFLPSVTINKICVIIFAIRVIKLEPSCAPGRAICIARAPSAGDEAHIHSSWGTWQNIKYENKPDRHGDTGRCRQGEDFFF